MKKILLCVTLVLVLMLGGCGNNSINTPMNSSSPKKAQDINTEITPTSSDSTDIDK